MPFGGFSPCHVSQKSKVTKFFYQSFGASAFGFDAALLPELEYHGFVLAIRAQPFITDLLEIVILPFVAFSPKFNPATLGYDVSDSFIRKVLTNGANEIVADFGGEMKAAIKATDKMRGIAAPFPLVNRNS